MASHISDDDEDYDDPIKLFDSSESAVYFGSKAYKKSTTTIDFSWKSEKTSTDPERPSPIEASSGSTSDILRQLSVKLVDCGQYPWYYRKYTQQILDLTGIELDSDSEVDVEGLDNSDENDCIIVEGLKYVSNNTTNVMNSMESVLAAMRLSQTREKRQNTLRLKEEIEIQRALSLKNTVKVDLKRNQGLVGMKIKNLPVTINFKNKKDKKRGLKQDDKTIGDVYVHAADKVLQHIGTELIPIVEKKNDESQGQELSCAITFTIGDSKETAIEESTSSSKANSTTPKNINEICEQLLDNMKAKNGSKVSSISIQRTAESHVIPTTKPTNEISTLEIIPIVLPTYKSQRSVKDVTKTNKFKNDQLKNQTKAFIDLTSKPSDNISKISNTSGQIPIEASAIKEIPKQNDDKSKCEPNSPILPSSLLIKSKSKRGLPPKCSSGNSFCDRTQDSEILNKSKQSTTELFGDENVKQTDVGSKNTKEASSVQNKTTSRIHHDIEPTIIKVSEKHVKKANEGTRTNLKNMTLNYKETSTNSQKDSVAVMNKKASDTGRKAIVPNQNMVVTGNKTKYVRKNEKKKSGFASIENSSLLNGAVKPNFNESMSTNAETLCLPCHSYKPTHTSHANNSNCVPNMTHLVNPDKGFEQSFPITSHVAQKPNIQTSTPKVSYKPVLFEVENNQKTNAIRKSVQIPFHLQPRWPYYQKDRFQFQSELPCKYSQYVQIPANSTLIPLTNKTMQNYLPPFRGSVYPGREPIQNEHVNNDWQFKNTAPFVPSLTPQLTPQKSTIIGNPGTQYSGTPFQSTAQISQNAPLSMNPTYAHYLNTNNGPLISKVKDNVKKTYINSVPNIHDGNKVKRNVDEMSTATPSAVVEVVATKTEMLKELDKLAFDDNAKNDLKRKHPEDASEIKRTSSIESLDVLKKKVIETFTAQVTNRNDSKIELQHKYSPPILPILRYDKVLEHVNSDPRRQIDKLNITPNTVLKQTSTMEIKPAQNTHKRCRKRLSHEFKADEPSCSRKRYDGKKISLEEYKQRVYVKSAAEVSKRRMVKDNDKKYNDGLGRRMYKKHLSRNAESDLGYDSDSTVVL